MRFKLTTKRLEIIPLNEDEVIKYLEPDCALEKAFGVEPIERNISEELIEALKQEIIPSVIKHKDCNYFYTLWVCKDIKLNAFVGDLCFKGDANDAGEVEIGYGVYDKFKNNGYITEAVGAVSNWAINQNNIYTVVAETDINNIASCRVLEKNHFIRTISIAGSIKWNKYKQTK